jgi:amidase
LSDLELCYLSATEALAAFRKKSLSPVELLNAQLERIAAVGSDINAFSFLYADDAIAAAKEAERRYSSGTNVRPLEGIPVAIKDESLIAGKITTFGSLIFQNEVASVTSPVNEHLIDAGAVVMGRTTTPEFSCAGFTHSRLWDRDPHLQCAQARKLSTPFVRFAPRGRRDLRPWNGRIPACHPARGDNDQGGGQGLR